MQQNFITISQQIGKQFGFYALEVITFRRGKEHSQVINIFRQSPSGFVENVFSIEKPFSKKIPFNSLEMLKLIKSYPDLLSEKF